MLIAGSPGVGNVYQMLADQLTGEYTVVTYDRRGFSRSALVGDQDYEHRIDTDADDVRRLIEHVSPDPAIVFGASSGALIGLHVLTHHPSVVGTLVAHEPPAATVLADGDEWVTFFSKTYDLYRGAGIEPALEQFRERAFAESDRQAMSRAPRNDATIANAKYWFEHELRQYPPLELDLVGLGAYGDRVVLTVGADSRGYPCYEASYALGEKLGQAVVELPGGHVGYITRAAEYANALKPHLPL